MKNRINLADLAPRKTPVQISLGEVEVGHIGAGDIGALMLRFPELTQLGVGDMDNAALARIAPDAIPLIIAAACGGEAALAGVRALTAVDQMKLLAVVMQNSLPGGVAGFLAEVTEVAKAFAPDPQIGAA